MKTVLFLLLCPGLLWAQTVRVTPDDLQRNQSYLILRDGSIVRGKILRQDSLLTSVRQRGNVLTFVENDQLVRILSAQPDPATASRYRVFVFRDSSRVEGEFIRQDSTMITVRKRDGRLTYFEPELLVRVDSAGAETAVDAAMTIRAKRTYLNQFSPWLLTNGSAYNPEKGRFYYRNTWLLLNEFDYGITRHWSVGASFNLPTPYQIQTEILPNWAPYLATTSRLFTKVSVPFGRAFRLGVNATYQVDQRYEFFTGTQGRLTLRMLATVGSSQRNVTVGYGIAVPRGQFTYWSTPVWSSSIPPTPQTVKFLNQMFLTLGLAQRVSDNLTFISDNRVNVGSRYTFYVNEQIAASAALRLNRQRHAFDLGVLSFVYEQPYLGDGKKVRVLPYVGYNLLMNR